MDYTEFDLSNEIEATIVDFSLKSEGVVLWRGDFEISRGIERHIVGVVAGPDGPEIFQAHGRQFDGEDVNTNSNPTLKAPLSKALRQFIHNDPIGESGMRVNDVEKRSDPELVDILDGSAKHIGRYASSDFGVYTLRITKDQLGEKEIAIAVRQRDQNGNSQTEIVFRAGFEDIRDWATELFEEPVPAGPSGP